MPTILKKKAFSQWGGGGFFPLGICWAVFFFYWELENQEIPFMAGARFKLLTDFKLLNLLKNRPCDRINRGGCFGRWFQENMGEGVEVGAEVQEANPGLPSEGNWSLCWRQHKTYFWVVAPGERRLGHLSTYQALVENCSKRTSGLHSGCNLLPQQRWIRGIIELSKGHCISLHLKPNSDLDRIEYYRELIFFFKENCSAAY